MPYFQGQAVGDDYLQSVLGQYRNQNPSADMSDQNVLNVLEGRGQPTWALGGGPQLPPGIAPPGGMLPQPNMQLHGQAGQWNPTAGGMTPLSAMGRGFGGSALQPPSFSRGGGLYGGYGGGYAMPQAQQQIPGYTPGGLGYSGLFGGGPGSMMPLSQFGGGYRGY